MPGYRSEFFGPYMPRNKPIEPGALPPPNYRRSGDVYWGKKRAGVEAAKVARERARKLGHNLGFNGGKRTRKNKSKKRSKSRKN